MGNKSKNLGWKIGGGIIVLFIGLVVGLGFWLAYEGDPKEIISVADQFKPGVEWKLTNNHVEPPQNSCIDIECPSVSKTWESSTIITMNSLDQLIQQAGWQPTYESDCFKITEERPTSWCDVEFKVGNYYVTLDATNRMDRGEKNILRLYIRDMIQ